MSIQQSINQTLTGATFLLSQTPLAESSRTKSRLKVEEREEIERGKKIAEAAERQHQAQLAPNEKVLDDALASGVPEMYEQAEAEVARNEIEAELAHAETLKGVRGQEEEYGKHLGAAMEKRAATAGGAQMRRRMVEQTRQRKEEAEMANRNTEEFRKRILEGTYRKGERL